VIVARATALEFPLVVEALGNARANESIEVRPRISSTVTAIRFSDGQHVSKGDVLVELENAELQAAVAEAKAALVDSESKYERAKELFQSQPVSDSQMETLKGQRDSDRAALDAAEVRLAETVVRAPFSGRAGLRRVSLGSLVGPSTVRRNPTGRVRP
jgi:membrane fusion protein (multidrug efflux system)